MRGFLFPLYGWASDGDTALWPTQMKLANMEAQLQIQGPKYVAPEPKKAKSGGAKE